jgi:hypothetical protein
VPKSFFPPAAAPKARPPGSGRGDKVVDLSGVFLILAIVAAEIGHVMVGSFLLDSILASDISRPPEATRLQSGWKFESIVIVDRYWQ